MIRIRLHTRVFTTRLIARTMASSTSNTASASDQGNHSSRAGRVTPLPVPAGWTLLAHKSRPFNTAPDAWPYTAADFERADESADAAFYSFPRYVAHIDEAAMRRLSDYYAEALPRRGRILDFCSSWISHYPDEIDKAVARGDLEVLGTGMNVLELKANPMLVKRKSAVDGVGWPLVRDLNVEPDLSAVLDKDELLDAATCVVSIDYLTQPKEVLSSLRRRVKVGGVVHLVLSNRCFHTKAVNLWLRSSEDKRLDMVADYLSFSGWGRIEVLESRVPRSEWVPGQVDPLWIVRAVNDAESHEKSP